MVKVGILKLGNIGSAPLIEHLLDERADREDITLHTVGTGPKLTPDLCKEAASTIARIKPDLCIVISPNASLPGPTQAREILKEAGIPTIVVSDKPAKKIAEKLSEDGFGYIIINPDPMIGARREFLDPAEMALFNSYVINVLSICGVFNLLTSLIDNAINSVKSGKVSLPSLVINVDRAVSAAKFSNPYSEAKARAALTMLETVADLTTKACFIIKEWEKYTIVAASAHELARTASKLADEVREIEKMGDRLARMPHAKSGDRLFKRELVSKPTPQTSQT